MFRITSQLCEVFDCTDQQLEERGLLEQFHSWLKNNPDLVVSHSVEFGEETNKEIADRFFEFYKNINQENSIMLMSNLQSHKPKKNQGLYPHYFLL